MEILEAALILFAFSFGVFLIICIALCIVVAIIGIRGYKIKAKARRWGYSPVDNTWRRLRI